MLMLLLHTRVDRRARRIWPRDRGPGALGVVRGNVAPFELLLTLLLRVRVNRRSIDCRAGRIRPRYLWPVAIVALVIVRGNMARSVVGHARRPVVCIRRDIRRNAPLHVRWPTIMIGIIGRVA